jgi:hypothetical protein
MYLESAYIVNSFDISIVIKILFFRVSVTNDLSGSLLTLTDRYHELFDTWKEH